MSKYRSLQIEGPDDGIASASMSSRDVKVRVRRQAGRTNKMTNKRYKELEKELLNNKFG